MNVMIRTASVVALVTFWLAAIVWTVLIVAAPANAETGTTGTTSSSGTSKVTVDWSQIGSSPEEAQRVKDMGGATKGTGTPTSSVSSSGGALTSSNTGSASKTGSITSWVALPEGTHPTSGTPTTPGVGSSVYVLGLEIYDWTE